MQYPPLVQYNCAKQYGAHFHSAYCRGPVTTFDGIAVRFRRTDFDHCFFESVSAKDDTFSSARAERIDWIKAALQDPNSERYLGWDKKKRKYRKDRRVTVVMGNYVVVIALTNASSGDFVTAFVADNASTLQKIRTSPKWI